MTVIISNICEGNIDAARNGIVDISLRNRSLAVCTTCEGALGGDCSITCVRVMNPGE